MERTKNTDRIMKYGDEQNTGIAFVLTYVVKYEKQTELQALVRQFSKFKKENPKALEGLK
jgi:hypothetical protein